MNIKDLKIGTQFQIGFVVLILFVILLGTISFHQSKQINQQIELMYNHPLKVRKAIDNLKADILSMRLGTRDLMLANRLDERQTALQLMELSAADAFRQFQILESQYLGPPSDIDEAYKAFLSWKTVREENTKLALSGEIEKVKESVKSTGYVGIYRDVMLAKIQIIDTFATNKAESLFASSKELYFQLTIKLIFVIAIILLLSITINYILSRNIQLPLNELITATHRFHNGDLNSRSNYKKKNEFGVLSASYNILAESIQLKTELDEKVSNFKGIMLSENETKKFFHKTIVSLADQTGSQMAAIYLLNEDENVFEHLDSIGLEKNARQSFRADNFEGEFGAVLSSHKVQHLKDIPEDTRFIFNTVAGKLIPKEIITLPLLANRKVIAIISLAGINKYDTQPVQLIDKILITLSNRIEGVLAYQKVKEFSGKLEGQNRELESQKKELSAQSAELQEQNTELEMQKNQLNEVSRLKTNFLSNMSHELRTPLNSVIALSGVLNRRLVNLIPEEEYSYLEVIERNGKHLLELINDILDISRIEAGKEEIEISNFIADDLISDVVSMIHPQAKQKNIELLYSPGNPGIQISSDGNKCRHILQNLISNAVKFTEKGKVDVKAQQSGKRILITVKDTGIGISEKHLPYIFDEFRQADGSTSRKYGGTGLGLAIAKKYSNLLGGKITVISIPDKGSEFILDLPLVYAAENRIYDKTRIIDYKSADLTNIPVPLSDSSIKTILLVEDNEPAIIQIKDFLEESGYRILIARDGHEALIKISEAIPDAMILDLMMPGIDGFEVLKAIRNDESTAYIPVLILTAKQITKDELNLLKRNNIHQLIQKGAVSRNELLNNLSKMIFSKAAEEEGLKKKPKRPPGRTEELPVILIAEDNSDNLLTIKALLNNKYRLIEATDGDTCVSLARKYIPDIILMDIALPLMDGIEALKIIRKDVSLKNIPIIALTASAMTSDRETILSYGFEAYITKPIEESVLFKIINDILYE